MKKKFIFGLSEIGGQNPIPCGMYIGTRKKNGVCLIPAKLKTTKYDHAECSSESEYSALIEKFKKDQSL